MTRADQPALSVCIVTYERPAFVRRCLESLDKNLTADVEVVVVDASANSQAAIVAQARPSALYIHRPELAGWMTRSRNEALRHVTGAIVSFLDDDVVISATWQEAVLAAFQDDAVDAVAGRTRNRQPGEESYEPPIGRLLPDGSLTEGFASLPSEIVLVDHGIGANMSFRRTSARPAGRIPGRLSQARQCARTPTSTCASSGWVARRCSQPDAVVDHLPAPHVKGARFDTRYKLYARRNHMVLLARYDGIRSPLLRRWIAREFREVGRAPGALRKAQRFVVTALGIAWGAAAMARKARWRPLPPERDDRGGRELQGLLSR